MRPGGSISGPVQFALADVATYALILAARGDASAATVDMTINFLRPAMKFPLIAEATSDYSGLWLVKLLILISKAFFFICVIIMLRWTIPRFRFDQLMELAWKVMIPLSLANLVMVMFCRHFEFSRWWLFVGSLGLFAAWGVIGRPAERLNDQPMFRIVIAR